VPSNQSPAPRPPARMPAPGGAPPGGWAGTPSRGRPGRPFGHCCPGRSFGPARGCRRWRSRHASWPSRRRPAKPTSRSCQKSTSFSPSRQHSQIWRPLASAGKSISPLSMSRSVSSSRPALRTTPASDPRRPASEGGSAALFVRARRLAPPTAARSQRREPSPAAGPFARLRGIAAIDGSFLTVRAWSSISRSRSRISSSRCARRTSRISRTSGCAHSHCRSCRSWSPARFYAAGSRPALMGESLRCRHAPCRPNVPPWTETAFEAAARARALEATGRHVIHLEIGSRTSTRRATSSERTSGHWMRLDALPARLGLRPARGHPRSTRRRFVAGEPDQVVVHRSSPFLARGDDRYISCPDPRLFRLPNDDTVDGMATRRSPRPSGAGNESSPHPMPACPPR